MSLKKKVKKTTRKMKSIGGGWSNPITNWFSSKTPPATDSTNTGSSASTNTGSSDDTVSTASTNPPPKPFNRFSNFFGTPKSSNVANTSSENSNPNTPSQSNSSRVYNGLKSTASSLKKTANKYNPLRDYTPVELLFRRLSNYSTYITFKMPNNYNPVTSINSYIKIKNIVFNTESKTDIDINQRFSINTCFKISITETYELYELSKLFVQYFDDLTNENYNIDRENIKKKYKRRYYDSNDIDYSIIDSDNTILTDNEKVIPSEKITSYEKQQPIEGYALTLINEYNKITSGNNKQCTIALFNCSKNYINELISIIKTQNIDDTNASNNSISNDNYLDSLNDLKSLENFESTKDKNEYVNVIAKIFVYINNCKTDPTKQKPLKNNVIYLTILLNNFAKILKMLSDIYNNLYDKNYIYIYDTMHKIYYLKK
jgi:hypothetical protein